MSDRPGPDRGPSPAADPQALAERAAAVLAQRTGVPRHEAVVVLGSGWGPADEALGPVVAAVPYVDLPGFHQPVAPGHPGLARSHDLDGHAVLALLGRTHLYEGLGVDAVAHPVRTAAAAGCRVAVLTNANGSLRPDWPVGSTVLVADHINTSGRSPLVGAQFVDLTDAWSPRLRMLVRDRRPDLPEGVYAMLPGPHYETPAEAGALRAVGADVLGMSTVLEAIAARALGVELLGLSTVTAIEASGQVIDPDEVVAAAEMASRNLGPLLADVLRSALSD